MADPVELFSVGYQRWPASNRWERLTRSLQAHRVEVLVDVRHSPCSSELDPSSNYGPRDWHLQADGRGIAHRLREAGIEYLWLGELGNPQKRDAAMRILREQLADRSGRWPVHRGIELLRQVLLVQRKRCCLMCACAKYDSCHRRLIVEALNGQGQVRHRHLAERTLRRAAVPATPGTVARRSKT